MDRVVPSIYLTGNEEVFGPILLNPEIEATGGSKKIKNKKIRVMITLK